jgi:hypothetical protein
VGAGTAGMTELVRMRRKKKIQTWYFKQSAYRKRRQIHHILLEHNFGLRTISSRGSLNEPYFILQIQNLVFILIALAFVMTRE